jgi:hypothetical protein
MDKALDLTDKLATATPPEDSTDRARVLRAVIFTGELKGAKELAKAYSKGAEKAKSSQTRSAYRSLQHDNLMAAEKAALGLAITAHQPKGIRRRGAGLAPTLATAAGPLWVRISRAAGDAGRPHGGAAVRVGQRLEDSGEWTVTIGGTGTPACA